MKLIKDTAEIEPSLIAGFQQDIAPACFGMVGYTDEFVRLRQVDAFGVPIS
jgi:hypothetical protein